eukprot:67519_1
MAIMTTSAETVEKGYLVIDNNVSRDKILQRIEHVLMDYAISNDVNLINQYRMTRNRSDAEWDSFGRIRISIHSNKSTLSIDNSRRHAGFWRVLCFIYEKVSNPFFDTISNRELYYILLEEYQLFRTQLDVDSMVLSVSEILRVPRTRLGLAAASRGAMCGKCKLFSGTKCLYSGHPNRLNIDSHALIFDDIHWVLDQSIRYIIIVEKDACFDQLCNAQFCITHCILVTGGGYPPLLCRQLIRNLHDSFPHLPIFCFVDCDAHGLDIFLSYQQGTINAAESYLYAIPRLLYLGVEWSDIERYKIDKKCILNPNQKDVSKLKTLQPFLKRKKELYFDRNVNKTKSIEYGVFQRIVRQMFIQMRLKKKIEIESLNSIDIGNVYIPTKIQEMIEFYRSFDDCK